MKKIFRFFGAFLTVALTVALTGCSVKEDLESADVGLHIKVFFPTKVVAGHPMTINGSGFSDVTEIVFPGDVVVTDFEVVSNDMIRVNTPSGISPEGGHVVVRTAEGEAESPLPLTLGNTVVTGCTLPEEGASIQGGSQMTIYGTDLEFITKIEMLDEDGNPLFIDESSFIRKGTSSIIFIVPKKIFDGEIEAKLYTSDGKTFTLPKLTYSPPAGYWEVVKKVLWENPDPAGNGEISWSGQYRFGLEGTDGNNECIATFPAETWDIIKNGTFYLEFAATATQMRVTTGWWSTTWTGNDIMAGDERIIDNGDGTYFIEISLAGDPIVDLLDVQHLLFTGSGYTPLKIYVNEEVWVEGGGSLEIVKNVFWKNEDPAGNGEISWSGQYRFGLDGNDGNNECIATFPQETWDIIKNGTFYMSFQATAAQLRITDGWWSTTWTGNDIMAGDERIIDNGDGTFYIEINFAGDPLLDVLDAQHLLFTGSGYTPLELYTQEEVWVGGGEPAPIVMWENDDPAANGEISWNGTYRFALEGNDSLNECIATLPAEHWEVIKTGTFYLEFAATAAQLRITDGWWSTTWTGNDIMAGDERIIDNGDGTYYIEINFDGDPLLDVLDTQHLLFTGGGYTPLKLYYYE